MGGTDDEVSSADIVAFVAVGYYRSVVTFNGSSLEGVAEDDYSLKNVLAAASLLFQ